MRYVFSLLVIICFAVVMSVPASGAEDLKIGVFDIQRVMKESKTAEGYRQKLVKEVESKEKAFDEKQDAIRQIEDKLKKDGQKLTAGQRKSLEEKHANELKELKRMKEDMDSDLQKADRDLAQKAFQEIGDVIKKIAEKENYTIIFEKNSAGIVHFKGTVDITEKIITLYDKR